jgi:hypothetical protein
MASIYFNTPPPVRGCQCNDCIHWFEASDDELRIGALLGSNNRVSRNELKDLVLVHETRPVQLLGMERVTIEVLLQMLDPQDHQFVDPWDCFVFVWGYDVFTGQAKMFISGTLVKFTIANVKQTQYKLIGLNDRHYSTVLNLFDVETRGKLTYPITEIFWRQQIVRLWRASRPFLYRPSLLHALTSPLDDTIDSGAIEYSQDVPWTIPRYDTWTELSKLLSSGTSHVQALLEDFLHESDNMDSNNFLLRLPDDIVLSIVDWLEPETQAVLRRVCRRFEKLIRRPVTVTVLEWEYEKKIIESKIWEYR